MSFLDRFTSRKGKEKKGIPAGGPGAGVALTKKAKPDAEKQAFQAVPSGKKETPATAAKTAPKKEATDQAFRILLRPLVTEKSSRQAKLNQYSFEIPTPATKMDVRNAVHQVYGIRPLDVNIARLPGKIIRYGRTTGRQAVRKKAIVTLPSGKSIDVFSA